MVRPVTHFVGFRGEEFWSAVRVWGRPHYIHRGWDNRAQRDIAGDDLVVFATGDADQKTARFNFDDYREDTSAATRK